MSDPVSRFRITPRDGAWIGLLMACLIAIFAPASEMKPGGSRLAIGLAYTVLLVPGGVGAVSMLNFTSASPGLRRIWFGMMLFFTVITMVYAVATWHSARRYTREGERVIGKATEAHPEDHNQLLFTYRVGATAYQRSESAPGKAGDYFPGSPVAVYYYRSDPAHGFLAEPRWQPGLVLVQWLVSAGLGPLCLLFGIRVMVRLTKQPLFGPRA